jgi:drug/metabolite transporter (DMT)-like permease
MLVFLATILVNLSFALLVRAAQRRGVDVVASGIVNYLFAAATYWIAVLVTGTPYAPEAPRIGLAAGVFYVSTYLLLLPAMRIRGVAIAMGFVRLSVVIPLIAAVIVWHEAPGPVKQAGIVLALLALPMLSLDGGANSPPQPRDPPRAVLDQRHLSFDGQVVPVYGACGGAAALPGDRLLDGRAGLHRRPAAVAEGPFRRGGVALGGPDRPV